jgi:glyoxylase I family protein
MVAAPPPSLDHFALHVPERSDLDEWVYYLDQLDIPQPEVKSVDYADVVTFRDPDNIQLEICWPNVEFWTRRFTTVFAGTH